VAAALAAVAAGGVLATWGLNSGLPYLFRPDEDVLVGRSVRMAAAGSLDPLFANWPPLAFYIVAGAEKLTGNLGGELQHNRISSAAYITILLGAVSGSTPKLSAQIQWSPDDGTTFFALGDPLPDLTTSNQSGALLVVPQPVTPPTVPISLGTSVQQYISAPLPRTWRLFYTVTGSGASFAISGVTVNYVPN